MLNKVGQILFWGVLFSIGPMAYSQQISDPSDSIYTDLRLWEDRGLLHHLPNFVRTRSNS